MIDANAGSFHGPDLPCFTDYITSILRVKGSVSQDLIVGFLVHLETAGWNLTFGMWLDSRSSFGNQKLTVSRQLTRISPMMEFPKRFLRRPEDQLVRHARLTVSSFK